MNKYLKMLTDEGLSLIILKGGYPIFKSENGGITPLFKAVNILGLSMLEGSIVVDRIVGKAAALIVSYFKAGEVHCIVLSERGRKVLEVEGINHYWVSLTPEITSMDGTGICPFEEVVIDVEDPLVGYERIYEKLRSLGLLNFV